MLSSLLFVSLLTLSNADNGNTVLEPFHASSHQTAVLVMLPGAEIDASAYIPLVSTIQERSPYALWAVTVGNWMLNTVNPLQMARFIEGALNDCYSKGMQKNATIFLAGHSLAGVFLDSYVRSHTDKVHALMLYGSYVSHSLNLTSYPVPLLTIAGDQDGLCRLTRITKDFVKLGMLTDSTLRTPVILVPNVNHSQIASGPMPSNVLQNDLVADSTYSQAWSELANVTNAFMVLNGPLNNQSLKSNAISLLKSKLEWTNSTTNAYQAALLIDAGKNGLTPMAGWAQAIVESYPSRIKANFHGKLLDEFEFEETAASADYNVTTDTITFSLPYYNAYALNPLDISSVNQSPLHVKVRLVNKNSLTQTLPSGTPVTEGTCEQVNKATFNLLLRSISAHQVNRYKSKGKQLTFVGDAAARDQLTFIQSGFLFDKGEVQSTIYKSSNEVWCSSLTLSQAFEWVFIDSFRPSNA